MNNSQDLFIIYEGISEEKFLKFLSEKYGHKYNLIYVNANGKDRIIRKYKQNRKMYNYSSFVLMYDLDNVDTLKSIKRMYAESGLCLDNTEIFFVNPRFELIFLLTKKNSPNLSNLNEDIEKTFGIKDYRKKENQINKIIKSITEKDLNNLFERLKIINKDDNYSKSSNYIDLFEKIFKI